MVGERVVRRIRMRRQNCTPRMPKKIIWKRKRDSCRHHCSPRSVCINCGDHRKIIASEYSTAGALWVIFDGLIVAWIETFTVYRLCLKNLFQILNDNTNGPKNLPKQLPHCLGSNT